MMTNWSVSAAVSLPGQSGRRNKTAQLRWRISAARPAPVRWGAVEICPHGADDVPKKSSRCLTSDQLFCPMSKIFNNPFHSSGLRGIGRISVWPRTCRGFFSQRFSRSSFHALSLSKLAG